MNDILNVSPKSSYLTTKQWQEVVDYVKNRKNTVSEPIAEETEEVTESKKIVETQYSEAYEQLIQTTSVSEMYEVLLTIMNEEPEKLYEISSDELQTLYNMATQMNEENPSDDYVDLVDTLQYLAGDYDLNCVEVLAAAKPTNAPSNAIKLTASIHELQDGKYYYMTEAIHYSADNAVPITDNSTHLTDIRIPKNATVTLDLNGQFLGGSGAGCVVYNLGHLTIEDSQPNWTARRFIKKTNDAWQFVSANETDKHHLVNYTCKGGLITGGREKTSVTSSANGGGAIRMKSGEDSATLIINGGNIIGNHTTRAGGGTYGGAITMNGGQIRGNYADLMAGGCSVSGSFTMNGGYIGENETDDNSKYNQSNDDTIFYDNADIIIGYGSDFTLNQGQIDGNISTVYSSSTSNTPTATITGGIINGNFRILNQNKTKMSGGTMNGCIYMRDGDCTISDTALIQNGHRENGGGVCLMNGSFFMEGGTIQNATATENGGAIYVGEGSFIINGGNIKGNTAKGNGGGVFIAGGNFTMTDGMFNNNTSEASGGAIFIINGDIDIESGNITNNIALDKGGAIAVTSGNVAIGIKECHDAGESSTHAHPVIDNNIASDGGGIYVDGGITTMWCGDIKHNLTYEKTVNVLVISGGNFVYNGGTIGIPYDSGVFVNGGVFEDKTDESESALKHELHYHSVLGEETHNGKIPESKWIASPRGDVINVTDYDSSSITWADLYPECEFVGWESNEEYDTDEVVNLYAIWERK